MAFLISLCIMEVSWYMGSIKRLKTIRKLHLFKLFIAFEEHTVFLKDKSCGNYTPFDESHTPPSPFPWRNMIMDANFWEQLWSCHNITEEYKYAMEMIAFQLDHENRFSEPMPWIGMYIALASFFCTLPMLADLLDGLRKRQVWFPCKYFTLNAASLTVIAVAVKLPMDLTNLMPGYVDQATKLGSLSFMCTMMAYLLPSLATMNTKELITNFIALGVLVITLVVNVCIQINKGVLSYHEDGDAIPPVFQQPVIGNIDNAAIATIYAGLLLMLLGIYACSSLAILKSKQILESKYQSAHETYIKDHGLQQPGRLLTLEKLKQHVSNYWIMAATGSPQFMVACSATTSASGVICAFSTILHLLIIPTIIEHPRDYRSDYKWSMLVILIIQLIGAVLGTIASFSRCFAALRFKLSVKWIWNYIKVSKVESYWTHKLSDWKQSSIPFPSISRNSKFVILHLKTIILSICIGLQKTTVMACKMTTLIPILVVIGVMYSFRFWRWLDVHVLGASLVALEHSHGNMQDLIRYVLQLQEDMEFAERTLKGISKSVNRLIEKVEKQQPDNLMNLILAESRGFRGIINFDSHDVPPILSEENPNCWSLPLVTLTAIAISLSNTEYNKHRLVTSVSEGLVFVKHVEENLNATDEHVSIQKAARILWVEVEVYHKWLGNKLQKPSSQLNTARQILQRLRDTSKDKVDELKTGVPDDDSKCISISANSMYRITSTILHSYDTNIDEVTRDELFAELLSMIADILAACLTNLPQVIAMKCHTSAIEKREASVYAAAKLLGETKQIINTLKDRSLPCLNPEELAFIDEWRAYLNHPSP